MDWSGLTNRKESGELNDPKVFKFLKDVFSKPPESVLTGHDGLVHILMIRLGLVELTDLERQNRYKRDLEEAIPRGVMFQVDTNPFKISILVEEEGESIYKETEIAGYYPKFTAWVD